MAWGNRRSGQNRLRARPGLEALEGRDLLSGSPLRFDFGAPGSPVAEGYTQVTRSTAYSASLGHGWTSPAGALYHTERDQGDALRRDIVYSYSAGSFAVDVSNGTYEVSVTVGDAYVPADRVAVDLEGQRAGVLDAAGGQWVTGTYTVTVADGQLNLAISDLGGKEPAWIINALSISPLTSSPLGPPSSVAARPLTPNEVRVTWSAEPTGRYKVERSLNGVDGWSTLTVTDPGVGAYVDTGLTAGTVYYYRARATDGGGDSAPSAVARALTFERAVFVSTTLEMRSAIQNATPGTAVLLRPGVYGGENHFSNVQGQDGRPVVIAAADPTNQPIIRGGGEGLKFRDAAYLELWDLVLEQQTSNGINIDDANTISTASHHLTLRGLTVRDINASGNNDGIKLSGVDQFLIQDCTIVGWGGSGIDMVGCHDGIIERTTFDGRGTGAHGIEAKGGSRGLVIRDSRFINAGARAVQVGGTTHPDNFRPQPPGTYEAKDVTVEGNVIIGTQAAVAFVNVDGSTVRYNTIYRPRTWAVRILQETTAEGFVPCQDGVFTDNIVAFRSDEMGTAVNVGPYTAPETFQFARNWWFCINDPSQSRPSLPTTEVGGTYGVDPLFVDAANGDFRLRPESQAANVGAYAPRS